MQLRSVARLLMCWFVGFAVAALILCVGTLVSIADVRAAG